MAAVAGHKTIIEVDLHNNQLTFEGKLAVATIKREASNAELKHVFLNWQLPSSTYMDDVQKHLKPAMRSIMVDWMLDVAQMLPDEPWFNSDTGACFFLACNLLDRYLDQRVVNRKELQLAGVACHLVAVQHYEKLTKDNGPNALAAAAWFANMTAQAYTPRQVLDCASDVCTVVHSDIDQPTAHDFLFRYLTCTGWREASVFLAEYLLCLAAQSYSMLQHPPQVVAAAVVVLAHDALATFQVPPSASVRNFAPDWKRRLLRAAQVNTQADLIPCVEQLADVHACVFTGTSSLTAHRNQGALGQSKPGKLSAVIHYSKQAYLCVTRIPPTRPSLIGAPLDWCTFHRSIPVGEVGVGYKSKLLLNATDWTLHGAKRRRCF